MRFWIYLPIAMLGTLLAYPLVPVAVHWVDVNGRLPRVFRWLETHDNLGWDGPKSEPATRKVFEIYGERAGLRAWLWRNKAYTLRHWLRARITDDMPRSQSDESIPKRWGYSAWSGRIGPYWEWQPRLGFGAFHIKLRCGWKLKPLFEGGSSAAGIFTGVSIRSDDWDDYPQQGAS